LNVNAAPPDLATTSIALTSVLGHVVDRTELLADILARCEAWYMRLLSAEAGDGELICAAWAARLDTLGRDVTVNTGKGPLHGKAVGVSPEGALLVRKQNGQIHAVWGGDVTLQVLRLGGSPDAVL
jgi:BirA family biotin operon repressor/biotin-[acetyl-CoA-carboxylase] ligase